MKSEQIIADAEIAAVYFRALLDRGVPMQAAVSLTGSYALAKSMAAANNEKPKEPWEPDT